MTKAEHEQVLRETRRACVRARETIRVSRRLVAHAREIRFFSAKKWVTIEARKGDGEKWNSKN